MIDWDDELFTVQEVARMLRVDASTVRRWIKLGAIESIQLPSYRGVKHAHRIRRSTLEALYHLQTPTQEKEEEEEERHDDDDPTASPAA